MRWGMNIFEGEERYLIQIVQQTVYIFNASILGWFLLHTDTRFEFCALKNWIKYEWEQYFFKKKTKDRLIHDYKFISVPYFQFLMWTKKHEKKLILDFFRPNG